MPRRPPFILDHDADGNPVRLAHTRVRVALAPAPGEASDATGAPVLLLTAWRRAPGQGRPWTRLGTPRRTSLTAALPDGSRLRALVACLQLLEEAVRAGHPAALAQAHAAIDRLDDTIFLAGETDARVLLARHDLLRADEDARLAQHGWVAHYVLPDGPVATHNANFHTHGLRERCGQLDFQIVLPASPDTMAGLLADLARRTLAGERFVDGQALTDLIEALPVRLVAAAESGRSVLRVILPDPDGRFWDDPACDPIYARQHPTRPPAP